MEYFIHLAILFSIYAVLALSLNLVVGYTGLLSVAEAAFYGKPAIQLGSLGTTKLLPNVTVHHDFTTLSAVIKKSLAASLHTAEYERHLENYVAAAYDTGFGFDYVSAWERGKGNLEELWPVYKKELVRIFS